MDKKLIISEIQEYLEQQKDILFAYVYGSFVKNIQYRDIDLAIYSKKPELMKLGSMHTDLVKLTKKEIDLTYLNDLSLKKPLFAYNIVTTGNLIYNKSPDTHNEYKVRTLLSYFDTQRLRDSMNSAFLERLGSDNFGNRNYA